MDTHIPSAPEVRARLESLTLAQIDQLAQISGVPRPTLHKIRYGQTENPGIETVRMFLPHIDQVRGQAAPPTTPQPTTTEG